MTSAKLRLFVGLPLDDRTRQALALVQQAAAQRDDQSRAKLRLTRADQLHLTLKFIGWTDPDRVEAFRALVLEQARITAPITSRLMSVTGYPSPRRARVVVAELSDAEGRLTELAGRIESVMEGMGVARETRTFRPHVTLARANPPANLTRDRVVALPDERFQLSEMVLFQSVMQRSGSVYTSLCRAAFSAGP